MSCIIKTPTGSMDYDFIAFSFGGKHSYEDFGVYRVSEGDRYQESIAQKTDNVQQRQGQDGSTLISTKIGSKTFSVSIAFDNLTEERLIAMRRHFSGREVKPLWFSERPYAIYDAKVARPIELEYLVFDDGRGGRIYKGEGKIEFVCHYPYAHTPDFVDEQTHSKDGRLQSAYNGFVKEGTFNAYGALSTSSVGIGENFGDMPSPFIFEHIDPIEGSEKTFRVGDGYITIYQDENNSYEHLIWDSKTGMVKAKVNGASTHTPIYFTGKSIATLPLGIAFDEEQSATWGMGTVAYKYWYY